MSDSLFEERLRALSALHGWSAADRASVRELALLPSLVERPDESPTVMVRPRPHPDTDITDEEPDLLAAFDDPDPNDSEGQLGRFKDLGLLGRGGMAEVRRVEDPLLSRVVALKVIHPARKADSRQLARFVAEAETTAQLEHPGVVPVYESGVLPDGRYYFAMKEVRGRTLASALREHHRAGRERTSERRLLTQMLKVCEAVAYAHSRGVIHRDLKPANVMLGDFGEVLVMDWGISKILPEGASDFDDEGSVSPRSRAREQGYLNTDVGTVMGTPLYMSPEQAQGQTAEIGPAADVFSLGAMLYQVLIGKPPDGGAFALSDVVLKTHGFKVEDIPRELMAILLRALAYNADERFPNAGALAMRLSAWLDGSLKLPAALDLVARSDTQLKQSRKMDRWAELQAQRAKERLDELHTWSSDAEMEVAWGLEDDAEELQVRALQLAQDARLSLRDALSLYPGLPEATSRLCDLYKELHVRAEQAKDSAGMVLAEAQMRKIDPTRHVAYLDGQGSLDLVSDPPGAEVTLNRYESRNRRLIPAPFAKPGVTPLNDHPIPMGGYLIELRKPGYHTAYYPVSIGRGQRWCGLEQSGGPVQLLPDGVLKPDDIYVPAGTFLAGPGEGSETLSRTWVDSFVIKRDSVTNREFLLFLNDLVDQGREKEAIWHAPRERLGLEGGGRSGTVGQVYGRSANGHFELVSDPDGDSWDPDWPVVLVDWYAAAAYARWLAKREGKPWRLLSEHEWEKAARGTDGRLYPWGDHFHNAWCGVQGSREREMPARVVDFPHDLSPYGVRGMAGNISDWCGSLLTPETVDDPEALLRDMSQADGPGETHHSEVPRMVRKGAAWASPADRARLGGRYGYIATFRSTGQGFRVGYSLAGLDLEALAERSRRTHRLEQVLSGFGIQGNVIAFGK